MIVRQLYQYNLIFVQFLEVEPGKQTFFFGTF